MTFFFDNNVSPALVKVLQALSVDAIHLRDEFAHNAADEEWIPEVARRGWIVVTWDYRIYKHPGQRALVHQNNAKFVFLPAGFAHKLIWEQAAWIVKNWPKIAEQIERLPSLECARITDNGKLELLP